MEQGYNIYIDTDFERHGSDENWVDIMTKTLMNRECKIMVCFKTENYIYSYAALIELLTLRMNSIERKRGRIIPLDVIQIGNGVSNSDFSSDEVKKYYQSCYEKLKESMGQHFAENTDFEKTWLEEGIREWLDNFEPENRDKLPYTVEELLGDIHENYELVASNFYCCIADTMIDWFKTLNLNGNTKELVTSFDSRFAELKVKRFESRVVEMQESAAEEEILVSEFTQPVQNDREAADNSSVLEQAATEEFEEDSCFLEEPESIISKKKVYSVTGDIKFTLYGKEKSGNQSDLLFYTFYEVLKRHSNLIDMVVNDFNCASSIDYTKAENKNDSMPSYFRVCESFVIGEKLVCIGAAYALKDKLKLIAKLLILAGEPYDILECEGIELPVVKKKAGQKEECSEKNSSSDLEYWVFGQKLGGNQSDMMWNFYEKLMGRYAQHAEELTQLLAVKKEADVMKPNTKDAKPSYFRICRLFHVEGQNYYVGTAFSKDAKCVQIRKMIEICQAPVDSFRMEGEESAVTGKK